MKNICIIIIILLKFSINLYGQTSSLFIIKENGKEGFIDNKGNVIIQPIYNKCNDFSEGLASVRLNGRYGYINNFGNFVIEPIYDYATKFTNGIASVFLNGQVFFIDQSNKIIIDTLYKSIQIINKNKVIVQTETKNKGLLELSTGKLLLDTIYSSIKPFQNDIIVLKFKNKNDNYDLQYAVVDSLGNFIVDFGKYNVIHDFTDGFAKVVIQFDKNLGDFQDGVIDTKGNLLFKREQINGSNISGDFHNGIALIYLKKYENSKNNYFSYNLNNSYYGYMDVKGEIVLNDTLNDYLGNFSNNRTFIKNNDNNFILVDTKFQKLGNETFDHILHYSFNNGYALVKKDKVWGILDTNGNYVIKPKYDFIHGTGVIDNYFFYGVNINEKEHTYNYGISNLNGENIIDPTFQDFDHSGFVNGLLKIYINKLLTYIDKKGNIIWQEKEEKGNVLKNFNTDYMEFGLFYPSSMSKLITNETFSSDTLSVYVEQNNQYSYHNTYNGFKVFIYNNDKNNIEFRTQDGRLDMKVQALNENGVWKDIEYLTNSFCGNSYHNLYLKTKNYWEFIKPKYEGEMKTKLRIELKYIDPYDTSKILRDKKDITIYSNEFEGSINPAQFWNKEYEQLNGILDSFYD